MSLSCITLSKRKKEKYPNSSVCLQALVATVDSIDAFSLLQNMAPMSYDSSRLVDVACIAYAHIDSLCIQGLRQQFFSTVQKQFQVGCPILDQC